MERFSIARVKAWALPIAIVATGAILLQASQERITARLLEPLLVRSIDDTMHIWVQQVFGEVARAAQHVAEDADVTAATHLHEHENLAHSLKTMLGAGAISQIDVAAQGCACTVSISSEAIRSQDGLFDGEHATHEEHADHGAHGDHDDHGFAPLEGYQPTEQFVIAIHKAFAGALDGSVRIGDVGDIVPFSPEYSGESGWPALAIHTDPRGMGRTFGSTSIMQAVPSGQVLQIRLINDISGAAHVLGLMFWFAVGVIAFLGFVAVRSSLWAVEVAASGRMTEERARYLAEHDDLTGLVNRHGFAMRAEKMLRSARKAERNMALVQMDIDCFKDINDQHGHATGDAVLTEIATLLRSSFPRDALIARLGGDEFAAVVGDWMLDKPLGAFLSDLPTVFRIERDIEAGVPCLQGTLSGGYAVFPDDGRTLQALMKSADLALYAIKWNSRNAMGGYRPDMGRAFERRLWEIDGIRRGAKAGEIIPHYQPLINARTGEIEGFESLVRWRHPELGVLSPARFVNALEDAATSLLITETMLEAVTADIARWRAAGYDFSVGLNAGEADLRQEDFAERVTAALKRHGCAPHALAIEVTEAAANQFNIEDLQKTLGRISTAGLFVALDDFGTGGSSIAILKHLPCTAMKIDKSFVAGMTTSPDDLSIVRALSDLGHDLGLRIVAEGVETKEQADLLREIGVDILQGYHFGHAIPAEDVDRMLKRWPVAAPRINAA